MTIKLSTLLVMLFLMLTSCTEQPEMNTSNISNVTHSEAQFDLNTVEKTTKKKVNKAKIISVIGTEKFTLNNTVEKIESTSGVHLKLNEVTGECYTESSNSDFQLLFLRDTLISISFFDSSYQTSKGFKVGGKISKLLSIYPDVEYHESTNNMGDESYYITTKYYTTQPNDQGNAFTFHVSDSDPDTISIIETTNYLDDHSPCDAY